MALLWTDGRYFNQATQELSSEWTLMRSGMRNVPTINEWIVQNIPKGKQIGVDAYLISAAGAQDFINDGISLVPIGKFLILLVIYCI